MIKVIAQFRFNPDDLPQVRTLCETLVAATRAEEGCIQYDLLENAQDPAQLTILETWASQQALDVHSATKHFTDIVPQLAKLSVEAPVVTTYTQII